MSEIHDTESPDDFELTHHVVPGEPGRDHIEEMAEAFVIEFKRMRWMDEMILNVFRNPFYAGPHYVYTERGEEFVLQLLNGVESHSNVHAPSSNVRTNSERELNPEI